MADVGISNSVNSCLRLFRRLLSLDVATSEYTSNKAIIDALREEEARFKVWVGNIGAHKTGRSSLEYRLRDASHIQKQVVELIGDLSNLVESAGAIISGEKIPWDKLEDDSDSIMDETDSEADSGDDDFPKTELDQIVNEVADLINCLLRLSVAIRNPAPHDRFLSSVPEIDTDHYEPYDIQHVLEKFGQVNKSLAVRLGKSISRRRQYFKYRERHHQKLSEGISTEEVISSSKPKDTVSTIASSIPEETKGAAFDLSRLATVDEDAVSDSGVSKTSFASSVAESEKLKIPPVPEEAQKGPFECPFCFMMITASTTISWRRHVYGDLRPYICLAEECPETGREFARRHEWTAHELQNHWKKYFCPAGCNDAFSSFSRCRKHLDEVHPGSIPPSQVDALISLSARPMDSEDGIECPLCQEPLSSFRQYQRHVGRHQEQLALFALPPLDSMNTGNSEEENERSSEEGSEIESVVPEPSDNFTNHEKDADLVIGSPIPDESLKENIDEPEATTIQFKSQEDADKFRHQFEQVQTARNSTSEEPEDNIPKGEVETDLMTTCRIPDCNQKRCTSRDPRDPKESFFCREHACSVLGCAELRLRTGDPRGWTSEYNFEIQCEKHWDERMNRIDDIMHSSTTETSLEGKDNDEVRVPLAEPAGGQPEESSAQESSLDEAEEVIGSSPGDITGAKSTTGLKAFPVLNMRQYLKRGDANTMVSNPTMSQPPRPHTSRPQPSRDTQWYDRVAPRPQTYRPSAPDNTRWYDQVPPPPHPTGAYRLPSSDLPGYPIPPPSLSPTEYFSRPLESRFGASGSRPQSTIGFRPARPIGFDDYYEPDNTLIAPRRPSRRHSRDEDLRSSAPPRPASARPVTLPIRLPPSTPGRREAGSDEDDYFPKDAYPSPDPRARHPDSLRHNDGAYRTEIAVAPGRRDRRTSYYGRDLSLEDSYEDKLRQAAQYQDEVGEPSLTAEILRRAARRWNSAEQSERSSLDQSQADSEQKADEPSKADDSGEPEGGELAREWFRKNVWEPESSGVPGPGSSDPKVPPPDPPPPRTIGGQPDEQEKLKETSPAGSELQGGPVMLRQLTSRLAWLKERLETTPADTIDRQWREVDKAELGELLKIMGLLRKQEWGPEYEALEENLRSVAARLGYSFT